MTASNDSDWWMYSYKVQPCPIQERHDWSNCPNAHRGERAARRCPRTYSYTPEPCPQYNKTGACAQGASCPMAHSVFESWLHPSRFRTQLCCFGTSCKRRICFFAHDPAQLRAATITPNAAAAAAAAAAAGAPVLRRTQAVVPASMMPSMYASPGSSKSAQGPAAGDLAATAAVQLQLQQPQQLQTGQQMAAAGMPSTPWVYTSAGWVQTPAGMGQPMLLPVAAGMQGAPQMQQQVMMPVQGAGLASTGMQLGPGTLVPIDHAMLPGLAAGLSGLSLQDQQGLSGSSQALACMPMLPTSPGDVMMYQPGGQAFAMSPQGAVVYASPAGSGLEQQAQQQQQQLMVAAGGALSPAMPGQVPANPGTQQRWQ